MARAFLLAAATLACAAALAPPKTHVAPVSAGPVPAAIAAGTGPAETGATCVFGGASAAAQASVAAARRNARAMVLEPARAVRGPLMPGDVYDVYAMTRRSLLRSRTEEFQPRCRESDRHEQGCESTQRGVAATIFIVGRPLPAPDAARLRIKPDRSQSGRAYCSL